MKSHLKQCAKFQKFSREHAPGCFTFPVPLNWLPAKSVMLAKMLGELNNDSDEQPLTLIKLNKLSSHGIHTYVSVNTLHVQQTKYQLHVQ